MKDIFNFIIADDLKLYKDHQINIEVALISNNIKYYVKELDKLIVLYKKLEMPLFKQASILNKGKFHKKEDRLSEAYGIIKKSFDGVMNKVVTLFPEHKESLIKDYDKFLKDIDKTRENYYEGSSNIIERFYYVQLENLEKKYSMCEKLSKIEKKPLRAIVTFNKDSYDTHFTKYHLNLEEFSEQMHNILKAEFEVKYMAIYRALEKKHFNLLDNKKDNNLITLKEFLNFTDEVMVNYAEMKKYPENFLKAQIDTYTINQDVEGMIDLYRQIEVKFEKLYSNLEKFLKETNREAELNIIFIKALVMMYDLKLKDFILRDIDDTESVINFLHSKNGLENDLDYISLTNLMKIEPLLATKIFKNILVGIKYKGNFSILDNKGKFLLKKSERNLFDNNQFYSHQILFYEIVPNELNITSNRYMQNSGFDKVFVENGVLRFKDEVFSHILNKKIKYEFYLQTELFYVNVNNSVSQA